MHRRRRNNRGSVSKNLNNDDSDEDRGMWLVYTFLLTTNKTLSTLFTHPFSHSVCNNGYQMLSGVHGKR